MANLSAPMPSFATPFLKDGLVNEPWYRYLFQLQLRTGGAAGTDFVSEAEFQKLVSQVGFQDLEINGLYPAVPVLQPSQEIGQIPVQIVSQDSMDAGMVPIQPGTLSQQNADSVIITGGSIDGTPIGATTPSSGAFTTVTATTPIAITSGGTGASTASGARSNLGLGTIATQNANAVAITGGNIDGTAIGATTQSSGKFTTITASSTITPSSTSGIVGTTTNDNANTGSVGEYVTTQSSLTSISAGVVSNYVSVSLTAGDWDVSGSVDYVPAGTTTISQMIQGVGTTSAAIAAFPASTYFEYAGPAGNEQVMATPVVRISLSTTTTVYLTGFAQFAVSTCQARGFIRARRIR